MKTAVVTGATSGFGHGLVGKLLENNFRVIATGRNLTGRQEIFHEERLKFKDQLIEMNLDLGLKNEIDAFCQNVNNEKIDVLVNNAGYGVFGPAEECTEESLRKQFEVNFFGLFFLTQNLLPKIRERKGHIINFSSVFGIVGFPLTSAYCASKFAVEGYTESLSYELRPFDVQVTLVEPGGFRTKFNENSIWGMHEINPKSVYYRQIRNYEQFRKKLATRPNPPNPQMVVDGVMEIILKRKRKLSYLFGQDAKFTHLLTKVLNRTTYHKISGRFLDRVFLEPVVHVEEQL